MVTVHLPAHPLGPQRPVHDFLYGLEQSSYGVARPRAVRRPAQHDDDDRHDVSPTPVTDLVRRSVVHHQAVHRPRRRGHRLSLLDRLRAACPPGRRGSIGQVAVAEVAARVWVVYQASAPLAQRRPGAPRWRHDDPGPAGAERHGPDRLDVRPHGSRLSAASRCRSPSRRLGPVLVMPSATRRSCPRSPSCGNRERPRAVLDSGTTWFHEAAVHRLLDPGPTFGPKAYARLRAVAQRRLDQENIFHINQNLHRIKATPSATLVLAVPPAPLTYNPMVVYERHTATSPTTRWTGSSGRWPTGRVATSSGARSSARSPCRSWPVATRCLSPPCRSTSPSWRAPASSPSARTVVSDSSPATPRRSVEHRPARPVRGGVARSRRPARRPARRRTP